MTVESTTSKAGPYTGNGSTTVFPFGFLIFDASHLSVVSTVAGVDTVVDPSAYSVSGVGNPAGGSVTFSAAPLDAQKISIIRAVPQMQELDLENQGAYNAEDVERAFDLLTMQVQQLQEQSDRSVKVSVGSGTGAIDTLVSDVTTVAGIASAVVAVAGVVADVPVVAGIAADVSVVAAAADILSGTASAVLGEENVFVGDGTSVDFVLATAPPDETNLDVFVGGAIQPTSAYSLAGQTLTFSTAPGAGLEIIVKTHVLVTANEVYEARDQAVAAAASVPLFTPASVSLIQLAPTVSDAGKVPTVKTDGTGYELKPPSAIGGIFYPEDYGAKADATKFLTGAMTSGSATLTVTGANFTTADVGKRVTVRGAGTGGRPLWSTIAARISATQVTLAANAVTTVSGAVVIYGTDDTTAVQAALNAAGAAYGRVDSKGRRSLISSVTIKAGATFARLKVIGCGASPTVVTSGLVNIEAGMSDADIVADIDLSAGWGDGSTLVGVTALTGSANKRLNVYGCHIFGMYDGVKYGMWFVDSPDSLKITGNSLEGAFTPTITQNMISLQGNPIAFGGYLPAGLTARATAPATRCIVSDNTIYAGSYAVILGGAENCNVSKNVFSHQNHRGAYLGPAAHFNTVNDNTIRHVLSSPILCGYFSCDNVICGNDIFKDLTVHTTPTGEAAININTGSARNKVIGNRINSIANYGVYVSNGADDTVISGNDIRGFMRAGICVDSDWAASLGSAIFSRPNYAPPSDVEPSATAWTFANTNDVIIQNNVISDPKTGVYTYIAAIALAQPNSSAYGVFGTVIDGNKVMKGTGITDDVSVIETTSGRITNTKLIGNTFDNRTAGRIFFSRGRAHFSTMEGNDVLDDYVSEVTIASGQTTPSVAYSRSFFLGTTAGTSITDFTNGMNGQEIEVRLNSAWTIVNSSGLRLKGGTNVTGTGSTQMMGFRRRGNVWYEQWRNF